MIKKITIMSFMVSALCASSPSFAFNFDLDKAISAVSTAFNAATLSDSEVQNYAKQMAFQSDKTNTVAPARGSYSKRLAKIMKGYQHVDGLNLNFKVYMNKEVNAFAMADGTVRVYSGLLDLMTDDEIRFVLGHEIGHVKLGHSKAIMQKSLATNAALQAASAAGGTVGQLADSDLGKLTEDFLNAQYSQSDERAADLYGFNLLKTKGINQEVAVTALEKLAALGDSGGLMADHPSSQSRADRLKKLLNNHS